MDKEELIERLKNNKYFKLLIIVIIGIVISGAVHKNTEEITIQEAVEKDMEYIGLGGSDGINNNNTGEFKKLGE